MCVSEARHGVLDEAADILQVLAFDLVLGQHGLDNVPGGRVIAIAALRHGTEGVGVGGCEGTHTLVLKTGSQTNHLTRMVRDGTGGAAARR